MEHREMYRITLYDDNSSPIADGTVSFFTDDIEDFQERWFALDQDEDKKDRFLRSKAGELVTDYYSDREELNIVQNDNAGIYKEKEVVLYNKNFDVCNVYDWPYSFHAEKIVLSFRWIVFREKYYRIVQYKAEGIYEIDTNGLNHTVECRGNRIIENSTPFITKYRWIFPDLKAQGRLDEVKDFNDASKYLDPRFTTLKDSGSEAFSENYIQSICYVVSSCFKDEIRLMEDIEEFEINDEMLGTIFADIVGEA